MIPTPVAAWADAHPWPAAGVTLACALLAAAAMWRAVRSAVRPKASVVVAALAAAGCTAYGADTSWRFAEHWLGMDSVAERAALFAVAELALFSCALMARANLQENGSPGTPGVLVWVIVGVQIIPAYAESGPVGGTVRAFVGSVLAGLLWHQAMGIELRHIKPGALSNSIAARIGRDLRARLLSRLGIGTRDRTSEQITRERAMHRAVRLAALLALAPNRRVLAASRARRLAAAVHRAGIATDSAQRHRFMRELGARRGSRALATIHVPAPWDEARAPESAQPTLLGLAGAFLREMDPVDAVHLMRDAHPGATDAEVAVELTRHGVVVSETQVRIAARERKALTSDAHPATSRPAFAAGQKRQRVDVPIPPKESRAETGTAASGGEDAHSYAFEQPDPDPRIDEAREIDRVHRAENDGRPASLRALQSEMRIGQPRAQSIQRQLAVEKQPETAGSSS